MKIVKSTKTGISQAIEVLKNHGVVVYPTDTAYALGGIFNSKKVIQKILKIKNRKDNKFTVVASSLNQADKFFKLTKRQKKIAKLFWPGPLSIVVSGQFAVRVPNNKIALELAKKVGKPLIATSANVSGSATLYDSNKIISQFSAKGGSQPEADAPLVHASGGNNQKNRPDLILAGGLLKKVLVSTVVLIKEDEIKIIRHGAVKLAAKLK